MKYLIFGNGYLGNKFKNALENAFLDHSNINNELAVREAIEKHQPDVVINCAAKSGKPNIDWCEDHKLETLNSNLRGPLSLLKVTQDLGVYFVQLGSGCVYQGNNNGQGWSEEDPPNFTGSYYSKIKAMMNDALKDYPVLQLRLRMPLDAHPGSRNLITKISSYSNVINTENSITVNDDLIDVAKQLMEMKKTGIYNVVNPGSITHSEILDLYKELVDPNHSYKIISEEELKAFAKAPRSSCTLSTKKLEQEGIKMIPIRERLPQILKAYKENLAS